MSLTPKSIEQAERERIESVYGRRTTAGLYSRFEPGHLFMMQDRERQMLRLLTRYGRVTLADCRILEVGCGTGDLLRDLIRWGASPENLTAVEMLPERVQEAHRLCPAALPILRGDAATLPYGNERFDLVFQSTVFTSVLDLQLKKNIAAEMLRVLKPSGLIVWYDFHMNNPSNPDVRGVKLRELRMLFAGCKIWIQRITLAPPIARRLSRYSWLSSYLLALMPWFCTHYIAGITKR